MELLGEKNWWIPKWLDRRLPRLNIEGPELEALHARVTDVPEHEDEEPELVGAP